MNRQAIAAVDDGKLPGVIRVGTGDTAATATLMMGAALIAGLASVFGAGKLSPEKREAPPSTPPQSIIPNTVTADRPSYVVVPPYVEGETPTDILKPGGQLIGQQGKGNRVREVNGGAPAAEALFDGLSKGGTPTTPDFPGTRIVLPNGPTSLVYHANPKGRAALDTRPYGYALQA